MVVGRKQRSEAVKDDSTCPYITYTPLKFDVEVVETLEEIEKALRGVCIEVYIHDVCRNPQVFVIYSRAHEGLSVISKHTKSETAPGLATMETRKYDKKNHSINQ